jgi:hypothetical protein
MYNKFYDMNQSMNEINYNITLIIKIIAIQ